MYSNMLYAMAEREQRLRMTFRLPLDLVAALRQLPSQTAFLEAALREALGRICPVCHGTGEAPGAHLSVSNLKRMPSGRLDRETAAQLKALVRLGRELLATQLELEASAEEAGLGFRLERDNQVLLAGRIPGGPGGLRLTH
jgi:hypothetical protein